MKNTPVNSELVDNIIRESNLSSLGSAGIRDIVKLVNKIEAVSGEKFIRMEMGVPGLSPPDVGINAEISALQSGVASSYPMIEGVPQLKSEASRFIKLFMNVNVDQEGCIPTVGSIQASMAAFMTVGRSDAGKDTTLLIDPGFSVHKMQLRTLGLKYESFDVYEYRGEKLRDKLESYFSGGKICSLLFSNPNNPSWICFSEKELEIIGELANKYDVIIIEDLAYFAMDFRKDLSQPGSAPYQVSVAKYTDNYILLLSSSKAFSFAGQRIGIIVVSDALFKRKYEGLKRYFPSDVLGYAIVYGALYALSAGANHSSQYGLAAMLKAANDGVFNFVKQVREYGEKAVIMKKLFLDNGFFIVYDMDEDQPLADGFYFTIAYPGLSGGELLEKLLYYGISAISLAITGSTRKEGLRACVSQVSRDQFPVLEQRLKSFHLHHENTDNLRYKPGANGKK